MLSLLLKATRVAESICNLSYTTLAILAELTSFANFMRSSFAIAALQMMTN
jgi:hypothetical protein